MSGERRWPITTLAQSVSSVMSEEITNKISQQAITESSPAAAKAWVNFNGEGTTSGQNLTIRSSFNITSVIDRGLGYYEINMTSGLFSDTNYLVHSNIGETDGSGPPTITLDSNTGLTSSSFRLWSYGSSSSETDRPIVMVTIFGN